MKAHVNDNLHFALLLFQAKWRFSSILAIFLAIALVLIDWKIAKMQLGRTAADYGLLEGDFSLNDGLFMRHFFQLQRV